MAFAKLNVLHLHFEDSQSFPMQTVTFPNLWAGAWSPAERFSLADIADLVEYARLRGIRVMLEVDVPGTRFAAATAAAQPESCRSGVG